jgi:hypothetical protein
VLFAHVLPAVVQVGLGAIDPHLLLLQWPVQQSAGDAHAAPIDAHCEAPQTPLVHVPVQQSEGTAHEEPACEQTLIDDAHFFVLGSQSFEQQSLLPLQVAPKTAHAFVAPESALDPSPPLLPSPEEALSPPVAPSPDAPSPALPSLAEPSAFGGAPSALAVPSVPPSSPVPVPVSSVLPHPVSAAVVKMRAIGSQRERIIESPPRNDREASKADCARGGSSPCSVPCAFRPLESASRHERWCSLPIVSSRDFPLNPRRVAARSPTAIVGCTDARAPVSGATSALPPDHGHYASRPGGRMLARPFTRSWGAWGE